MTYLATLASMLLGRIIPNDEYITSSGSSHGANQYFQPELYNPNLGPDHRDLPITSELWRAWHREALERYSIDGLCIAKDGWTKFGQSNWEKELNVLDCLLIISSPNTKLDWIYCWLNMVDKIPRHVYTTLMHRSKMWPKLWKLMPKSKRIDYLTAEMPIHPLVEDIRVNKPTLRILTTEILEDRFVDRMQDFLAQQSLASEITDEIREFHSRFVDKQMANLDLAHEISSGKYPNRGPYDLILRRWLETGWK